MRNNYKLQDKTGYFVAGMYYERIHQEIKQQQQKQQNNLLQIQIGRMLDIWNGTERTLTMTNAAA
jgi:hypothetical protein